MNGGGLQVAEAPVRRRVRAFFAGVDRTQTGAAGLLEFDVTALAGGAPLLLPAGWVEATGCRSLQRRGTGAVEAVRAGAPAGAVTQVRTAVGAELEVEFTEWGKLQTALSCGGQQMNVLAKTAAGTTMTVPLLTGPGVPAATATVLPVSASAGFAAGDAVVVDADYAGQTGYVGAFAAGGYVTAAQAALLADVDYVRRVSLNVGVVLSVTGGVLTLASPLPGGAPAARAQVSKVLGFADREGGGFFAEWSAVFCMEGAQGERLVAYYPRLLAVGGLPEKEEPLGSGLLRTTLRARFRAVPVPDAEDGTAVVGVRTYLPAAGRLL